MEVSTDAVEQQENQDTPQSGTEDSSKAGSNLREAPRESVPLDEQDKTALIQLVRKYKQSWFPKRRLIVRRVLKAYEFAKGNHSSAYDPESQSYVDAFQLLLGSDSQKYEDVDLYKFATNFYQMLMFAFVSALSTQVPETQGLPDNAEREEDIATAKAYSAITAVIDQKNNAKKLHKNALMLLWLAGCGFRHTRYVVDSLYGTHEEPQVGTTKVNIPSRFICPNCGSVVPTSDADNGKCPDCGAPLDQSQYYEAEIAEIPIVVDIKKVPNGMVAQSWHGPLEIDADPKAKNARQTAIINFESEVDIAAAREAFPGHWNDFQYQGGGLGIDGVQDKIAREAATTEAVSRNYFQEENVTISRTWIQPWALNKINDQQRAKKLKALFPDGCLLVNCEEKFLDAHRVNPDDEWTHLPSVADEFGLYPFGVGDSALSVQERINDIENLTHEYMDRVGMGISFVDLSFIDPKALNDKPILPGTLNGVTRKRSAAGGGPVALADAFHHFQATPDAMIGEYRDKLVFTMQLLAGTPPQVFGGAGDPNIQTKGGQEQQLNTALGKLMLFWDNARDEKAEASELAIKCAARNMTDDWFTVVTDESKEFRNQYVRMSDMQGNIHVIPSTDQTFPMTHAEIKAWWDRLVEAAPQNPVIQALLDVPQNRKSLIAYSGVPGLEEPDGEMYDKVLRILDLLQKQTVAPQQVQDSGTGAVVEMPAIAPDKDVDDMGIIISSTKVFLRKHFQMKQENPVGYAHCLAYLRLAAAYDEMSKIKQAGPSPNQGPPQPAA